MANHPRILNSDENFLGVDPEWESAKVMVWPVPLEQSTSYLQGTRNGPRALLKASRQVELYDDELEDETWRHGIVTLAPFHSRSAEVEGQIGQIEEEAFSLLEKGKYLVTLGGEHTVTVPLVRAHNRRNFDFSVLHLDAHADLRETYEGSELSHACVMARIQSMVPSVSVGIRSLCMEEARRIKTDGLSVYTIHRMARETGWINEVLQELRPRVYITLDLDVFDPSVLPSVGTPEPGGISWEICLSLMRRVFKEKRVIGLDIMELCPMHPGDYGPFTAAKLLYRLMGYWLFQKGKAGINDLTNI